MTVIMYFAIMVATGFFFYRANSAEFRMEGLEYTKNFDRDTGTYTRGLRKKSYNGAWIERISFWRIIIPSLFWPIVLPGLLLITILKWLYKKLKINNIKIFKENEELNKKISDELNDSSSDD